MQVDKESIVKGEVSIFDGNIIQINGRRISAINGAHIIPPIVDKAHAQLFADALEVFNKTNLTPSELLEQRESNTQEAFIKGIETKGADTFVLPEKWAVKDCEEVTAWGAANYSCGNYVYPTHYFHSEPAWGFSENIKAEYTEITFQQFQQYVLNAEPKQVKFDGAPVSTDHEQRFEGVVTARLEAIRELILVKGREYRRNGDVFHNFNAGGKMLGCTPERALLGFATKHFVSIIDLVNDLDAGKVSGIGAVNEKLGDAMVYLVLLEGLFKERINNV